MTRVEAKTPGDAGPAWQADARGWMVCDDGATLTVARRLPLRWDLSAETRMPDLGRRRLAHAVRQDLWRMLARLRGFAPSVSVTRDARGLHLRAGGRVEGGLPAGTADRVAQLLADAGTRAAWCRSARHPQGRAAS